MYYKLFIDLVKQLLTPVASKRWSGGNFLEESVHHDGCHVDADGRNAFTLT
jgi:hypothetical protein